MHTSVASAILPSNELLYSSISRDFSLETITHFGFREMKTTRVGLPQALIGVTVQAAIILTTSMYKLALLMLLYSLGGKGE